MEQRRASGRLVGVMVLVSALACAGPARADDFLPGSLVIPMDTTYQDHGMLRSFGLLYRLLQAGVPVRWCIRRGKAHGDVDFTTSAIDHESRAVVAMHGYRGGPFVIDAADAAAALPIIDAWQATNTTAVHEVTAMFSADVARYLVAAPSIAIFADGNEDIARGYLQAAGIPDSTGSLAWGAASPDLLSVAEVSGPTTTNHADGALFDGLGNPSYCQLMSMHWGVADARRDPEVVGEVRSFLNHPVHFFAECQAVNAFENEPTHGHFLTPHGFLIDNFNGAVDYLHQDEPFAQIDGTFELVGGSERAYSPCRDAAPAPCVRGGAYLARDIVMMTRAGTPEGIQDVWMTGYLDGACPPQDTSCGSVGKVSYLGGHEYSTRLPISTNPDTQGTRIFLQSLFEAPCSLSGSDARMAIDKTGVESTTSDTITYTLTYVNVSRATAYAVTLEDPLPAGATFVSATGGGVESGGVVRWTLGNVGPGLGGTVTVTVRFGAHGSYENVATVRYRAGTTPRSTASTPVITVYDVDTDGDGFVDMLDICPLHANPLQDLETDIDHCGACGAACAPASATGACVGGVCTVAACDPGFADADGDPSNGCETALAMDAGIADAGTDGGAMDAGATDAGAIDAGALDAGPPATDAGDATPDGGLADGGDPTPDAGAIDAAIRTDAGTPAMADAGGTEAGVPGADAGTGGMDGGCACRAAAPRGAPPMGLALLAGLGLALRFRYPRR